MQIRGVPFPRAIRRLGAGAALLALAACQTPPPPTAETVAKPPPSPPPARLARPAPEPETKAEPELYREVGEASWYGAFHDGKTTASGEPFAKDAMTAAHRTLPFDTRLRVTNLENGRSVEVTVTDRGPYVDDRIIDLSEAAARRLGFAKDGVTRVRLEELPGTASGKATADATKTANPAKVD